jgi:hypothetical protein
MRVFLRHGELEKHVLSVVINGVFVTPPAAFFRLGAACLYHDQDYSEDI